MGATNSIPLTLASGSLTNTAGAQDLGGAVGTISRLMGSMALVFAVLIGVVWVYRQWQRMVLKKAPVSGLRIVDVKNLGQRMAIYVVAYRNQQFLIGGSPNGLNLLSPLDSEPSETEPSETGATEPPVTPPPGATASFRSALDKALSPSP